MERGYILLAAAIIRQTIEDYSKELQKDTAVMQDYERRLHEQRLKDLEDFFISPYGEILCMGRSEYIFRLVQRRIAEGGQIFYDGQFYL